MIAGLGERVSRGEAIGEHDARLILDCKDLIAVRVAQINALTHGMIRHAVNRIIRRCKAVAH